MEPNRTSTVARAVTTALLRTLAAMAVVVSGGHILGAQAPAVVPRWRCVRLGRP